VLYNPSDAEDLSRAMQQVRGLQFNDAVIRRHASTFEWQNAAKQTILALNASVLG
jgi:hypothetical protein